MPSLGAKDAAGHILRFTLHTLSEPLDRQEKMKKPIRSDGILAAAVKESFDSLSPNDKIIIEEAADDLKAQIRNMGQGTAKEVLYQVGRILAKNGVTSV